MSEKKTIIKNNNYSDTYRRRRIPMGFCAAGEDGEDIDVAQIFVDRHGTMDRQCSHAETDVVVDPGRKKNS